MTTVSLQSKTCPSCSATLPLSEFGSNRARYDGLSSSCRACTRSYMRAYRDTNADAIAESQRTRRYGLETGAYDLMASAQDFRCAGCRRERPLVVDHCHTTGEVRALLCHQCNTSIGLAGDDPELLRRLADYLESFNGN